MNITREICSSPYSCYLNLTSKCNLRCKHCFGSYSVEIKNELKMEDWKDVINQLIKLKVFFINISGGEPTQCPYFREFIEYLNYIGMHFIITTNGVFSKEVREFIIKNKEYLIGIKISLDGPDSKSHGFIRLDAKGKYNPNLFKITLENINFFKKKNIPLTIATVLHSENIKKITKLEKLIKKINPISWFISPLIPIGRGEANNFIFKQYEYFNMSFWRNLKERGLKNKINVNLIDMPSTEKLNLSAYSCPAALNFCEIHSDGTISPCPLCRICIPPKFMKFENIKQKTIQEIWNGKAFNKFRGLMNRGCNGCRMLHKCNKCIPQSFIYFKNGTSPTPFCIKNGENLGLKNLKQLKEQLKENCGINLNANIK
jgi:MoaA/NifB/PqqE/SkfB family radical SAM enzyme